MSGVDWWLVAWALLGGCLVVLAYGVWRAQK